MLKPTKVWVGAAGVALLAVVPSNASVFLNGPVNNGPIAFSVSADYLPQPGVNEFYSAAGNWSVNVSFVPIGSPVTLAVVSGSMLHLIAPHAGELAPNPNPAFNFAFVVPAGGPLPIAQVSVIPHPVGPHSDTFSASIGAPLQPLSGSWFEVALSGTHPIPEPGTYAMLAALGLIGFGLYRKL